jgi:hypothetical protein
MIVEHFLLLETNLRMRRFSSTIMERAVAGPPAGGPARGVSVLLSCRLKRLRVRLLRELP